ncbi:MAG: hypothetical protein NWQ04_08505 [Opitutales bacterium]|nr:hypothetical protein [Opitutales bacterium]
MTEKEHFATARFTVGKSKAQIEGVKRAQIEGQIEGVKRKI